MPIRQIFRFSNIKEKIVGPLIFLLPVFFLTIKGWTNTISLILFLIALITILTDCRKYLWRREKEFWFLFVCLISPFLFEVAVHLMRGNLVVEKFDGPSRFLTASICFIFFSRLRIDIAKFLSIGSFLSLMVTTFSVLTITSYYWDGRAATYFVDPITLPVYLLACLALVQPNSFTNMVEYKKIGLGTLFILVVLVSIVLLLSQSRTAWVASIGLLELVMFILWRKNKNRILITNAALFILLGFSNVFTDRSSEAFREVITFINGHGDTSVGLRLGLIQMDIKLFTEYLFFGVPDGWLPTREWFNANGLDVSQKLYDQKLMSGSHNEITAHLSRKGLLGIPTVLFLFFFPILYFVRNLFTKGDDVNPKAFVGLMFCTVVFLSGLTIQVFNLKMTSTFYSMVLAILFASLLESSERRSIG